MEIFEFKNLPDESTPLNPPNLKKIQENAKKVFDGQQAMGNIIVENIECKNLFDGILESGTINNTTGQNEVDNMTIRSKHFIEVKSNIIYTLSNYINASNFVFEYDANYNFIKYSSSTEQSYTFTTTQTTKYIRFRTKQSENITNLTTPFQLERGNAATPFVKHNSFNPTIEDLTNKFIINSETAKISTTYQSKILKIGNIVYLKLFLTLLNGITTNIDTVNLGKLLTPVIPQIGVVNKCLVGTATYAGWTFDVPDGQVNINLAGEITVRNVASTSAQKKYIGIEIMYLV